MEERLASNEMIYENLSFDLYFLRRVISRKTRFLNISYMLFLVGPLVGIGLPLVKLVLKNRSSRGLQRAIAIP